MDFLKACSTHCDTIGPGGWRISIGSIIEQEVVLDTFSGIVDADKVKADGDRSSSRSKDGPFTVSIVWVSAWIARAGDRAAVSIKSPTTACQETVAWSWIQSRRNHPLCFSALKTMQHFPKALRLLAGKVEAETLFLCLHGLHPSPPSPPAPSIPTSTIYSFPCSSPLRTDFLQFCFLKIVS